MNITSNTYSKKYRSERNIVFSDDLGSEIELFDIETNVFFKLALFLNIESGSDEISNIFLIIFKKIIKERSKVFPLNIFLYISFKYFKKEFILISLCEIKKLRPNWILRHSDVASLASLDSKSSKNYFLNLEKKIFEDYITGWSSPNKCLEIEFKKVRNKFLIVQFKKKLNFFFFWFLIIIVAYICLHITSKENALPFWEQFKGWINFLLLRLR